MVFFIHQSAKNYLSFASTLTLSPNLSEENKVLMIQCFYYICSRVFEVGEINISSGSGISNSEDGMPGTEDKHREDSIPDWVPDILQYLVLF